MAATQFDRALGKSEDPGGEASGNIVGLICPPGWIRVYWSVKIIKGGNRLSPPVPLAPTALHLRPPHTASVFVFISVGGTIRLYLVLLWATCRHHHKGRGHYQKSIILGMNSRFSKKQHVLYSNAECQLNLNREIWKFSSGLLHLCTIVLGVVVGDLSSPSQGAGTLPKVNYSRYEQ